MNITLETPVGAAVADRPSRARVFDELGIDYCCHGEVPLGEACGQRGIDPQVAIAELIADDAASAPENQADFAHMRASELASHIVSTHHAYLKTELPRLAALLDKVLAAHRSRHPELAELRDVFRELHIELSTHLTKEEVVLFPLIEQLEAATAPFAMHCGSVNNPIHVMEHEHENAGSALEKLRSLSDDYTVPADGCASFRALYEGLTNLEADLHRHIHKENSILFPKATAMEEALGRA